MGASSSATGAMSEALGRVRAHGRLLLVGSLIVDIVLVVVVRHHFSSVGAVEVAGSAFAILTMVTGMFAGVQAGLAVGLFTGTVFYLFVAPSGTTAEKATTLLGILLWNAAAVLVALFAGPLSRRVVEFAMGGADGGRHVVVLPLPNDSAVEMRAALRAMLADRGVARHVRDEIVLAAQEAYNNAVVHPPGTVAVSARFSGEDVTIEVLDEGPGFDPARFSPNRLPDPDLPRGRGLYLMHRLMDKVEISASHQGTRVRLVKRIAPRGSQQGGPPGEGGITPPSS